MDSKVKCTSIMQTKTVYENFLEQKLECDIIIADYYPSAMKILKCEAKPCITNKIKENSRITLEGVCYWKLIYVSEQGDLKVINEQTRFSDTIILEKDCSDPIIKFRVMAYNVSCRLQNSRKASLKASISIAAKVKCKEQNEIICSVEDDNIETLFENRDIYTNKACEDAGFKILGELDTTDLNIYEIIDNSINILLKETKVIANKVIIKAEANATIIYLTDEESPDIKTINQIIPFTQIIEVQGADEKDKAQVDFEILSVSNEDNSDDGQNLLNTEIEIMTTACVYQNDNITVLTDAFSPDKDLILNNIEIDIENFVDKVEMNNMLKHKIELNSNNSIVKSISGKATIYKISAENNSINVEGDIEYNLIIFSQGEYSFFDKKIPFKMVKEISKVYKVMRCEASAFVNSISFTCDDNKVDLRSDVVCNLIIFSSEKINAISNIEFDDNQKEETTKPVVLYFADKGEKIWDIAKKYNTKVSKIKSINDVDEDVLADDKMLLISK